MTYVSCDRCGVSIKGCERCGRLVCDNCASVCRNCGWLACRDCLDDNYLCNRCRGDEEPLEEYND